MVIVLRCGIGWQLEPASRWTSSVVDERVRRRGGMLSAVISRGYEMSALLDRSIRRSCIRRDSFVLPRCRRGALVTSGYVAVAEIGGVSTHAALIDRSMHEDDW